MLVTFLRTFILYLVVVFGIRMAGGMDAVVSNAQALPGYLSMTKGYDIATGGAASFGGLSIISTLAWGLGYFGMPHILLRFMAIGDEKKLKLSRRVASAWVTVAMRQRVMIAIAIGIIGYSVSVAGKVPFLTNSADAETIIIKLADLMSRNSTLLAIVAGIILSGILAATMSTADSQLLAAASSVSQNLLQDVFGACTDGTAYADFCSAFFHCHHHDIRYTDGACQQGTQTYHPDQNMDTGE